MIISQTPFRISFFGGGTDYPIWYEKKGGAVISATINKYSYITCRYLPPYFDHKIRVVWSKIELVKEAHAIEHPAVRETLKFLDIKDGVEIQIHNDVPARSGLGASSAFTVGLLNVLYALKGKMISKEQLALNAVHLEQNILKENVGSQDQASAAFGGFNRIEFGGSDTIRVLPLAIDNTKLQTLQNYTMLFFTGLARNASDVAAEQIKNTPHKEAELKKMLSFVDEAQAILSKSDFIEDFGKLLHENWLLKRELTNKITNPEIDAIYETGMRAGAYGGKLLGAGGGGFMLFLIDPQKQKSLREKLAKLIYVPVKFENFGSRIIHYTPGEQSLFV